MSMKATVLATTTTRTIAIVLNQSHKSFLSETIGKHDSSASGVTGQRCRDMMAIPPLGASVTLQLLAQVSWRSSANVLLPSVRSDGIQL